MKILLIEDHHLLASMTADLIAASGHEVVGPAGTVVEAIKAAEDSRPDLALVDLGLPDGNGAELVPALRALGVTCIVVSGRSDDDGVWGPLAGIGWIEKPITEDSLRTAIDKAAEDRAYFA